MRTLHSVSLGFLSGYTIQMLLIPDQLMPRVQCAVFTVLAVISWIGYVWAAQKEQRHA